MSRFILRAAYRARSRTPRSVARTDAVPLGVHGPHGEACPWLRLFPAPHRAKMALTSTLSPNMIHWFTFYARSSGGTFRKCQLQFVRLRAAPAPRRIIRGSGARHLLSAAHLCAPFLLHETIFDRSPSSLFDSFLVVSFPAKQSWSFSEAPFKRVPAKKKCQPIFSIYELFSAKVDDTL